MMKFGFLLILCCCCGILRAQQFAERVYLKDSITVYEGFIVAQAPARYVRIYRFREKDTLQVDMAAIWKISREYATSFDGGRQASISANRNCKSVFAELGGKALAYSLNYDIRFARGRRGGWGLSAGISRFSTKAGKGSAGNPVKLQSTLLPLSVNYLFGQKRGFLEMGVGATLYFLNTGSGYQVAGSYFNGLNTGTGGAYTNFTIGYRHMPLSQNGITWRCVFSPILSVANESVYPWAGVSIGYQFW
jgi:hypothetical protein